MAAPSRGVPTSFQRKQPTKTPHIRGTKTSLQASLLLTPTGVPSLDDLVGGGVAVGSLLVVEEDAFATYSSLLTKYFVAEGMANAHSLFLVPTVQHTADHVLERLPALASKSGDSAAAAPPADLAIGSASTEQDLKIAWRYKHVGAAAEAAKPVAFSHSYDLSKTADKEIIANADVVKYCPLYPEDKLPGYPATAAASLSSKYHRLTSAIQEAVSQRHLNDLANLPSDAAVMRIVLPGIGSSLWSEPQHQTAGSSFTSSDAALLRFLYGLKAILRSSLTVGFVTLPAYLLKDSSLERSIYHLADCVVCLEAFADSPTGKQMAANSSFDAYKGFFKVLKSPRINSLSAKMPPDQDYVFSVTRKVFSIDKFHLPPDLSDTTSRSSSSSAASSFACSSSTSSTGILDF